jgi:hypothetical protein
MEFIDDDREGHNDDEDVADQQRRLENARRTAIDDIKWLMSSPRGRRIVSWLLDISGVNRSSYPCDTGMAFREGGRNIGLQLQDRVRDHALDMYIAMLNEQKVK